MAARKPEIGLLVSDIDGTILPYVESLARVYRTGLEGWAKARGMDPEQLAVAIGDAAAAQVAARKGTPEASRVDDEIYWNIHHDPARLPDLVPALRPRLPADEETALAMRQERTRAMRLFDGVAETFLEARESGVPVALLSDGGAATVKLRLAQAAKACDESGVLPQGVTFLDLISDITAVEDPPAAKGADAPPLKIADPALKPYLDAIEAKLHTVPRDRRKPDTMGLDGIRERHSMPPERTLVMGDGGPDGAVAKAAGCHFAWQSRGATVEPWVERLLNDQTRLTSYKVGRDGSEAALRAAGADLSVRLDGGPADLSSHFTLGRAAPSLLFAGPMAWRAGIAAGGAR